MPYIGWHEREAYVSNSNSHTPPTFFRVPQMTNHRMSKRAFIAAGITAAAGLRGLGTMQAYAEPEAISGLPDKGGTAPWDYWQSNEGTGTLRVAAAAILSANPYNTQPWLFRLNRDRIEILTNKDRNLAKSRSLSSRILYGTGVRARKRLRRRAVSRARCARFASSEWPGRRYRCRRGIQASRSVHS